MVKKTLLIPKEDWAEFKRRHPSHGSFTWFVRTALHRYNELNEVNTEALMDLALSEIKITED